MQSKDAVAHDNGPRRRNLRSAKGPQGRAGAGTEEEDTENPRFCADSALSPAAPLPLSPGASQALSPKDNYSFAATGKVTNAWTRLPCLLGRKPSTRGPTFLHEAELLSPCGQEAAPRTGLGRAPAGWGDSSATGAGERQVRVPGEGWGGERRVRSAGCAPGSEAGAAAPQSARTGREGRRLPSPASARALWLPLPVAGASPSRAARLLTSLPEGGPREVPALPGRLGPEGGP